MERISRRACLVTLGSSTLYVLSGCGGLFGGSGGGSGGGSLKTRAFTGTVVLPAGTDFTNLRVIGPFSISKIEGGRFKATGAHDFPSPVSVVDVISGKTVLLGMLDPASANQILGAANCAAALLFFALGGAQRFGTDRQTAWTAALASSQLTALAGIVAARLDADLLALENNDQAIIDALDDAAHDSGQTLRQAPTRPERSKTRQTRADSGEIFLEHPNSIQQINHISILNHNEQGVSLVNDARREGIARFYLAKREDENHQQTVPDPPVQLVSPIKIPPLTQTDMVPIEMQGEDILDYFDVIYLTPVFDAPEPEIFTGNAYQGEKATWRADLARLFQRAEIGLVAKVLLEAVGICGITLDSAALDQVIANMQAISSEASDLVLAAREGVDLSGGVKSLIQLASGSDQGCFDFLAAVAPLIATVHPVLYRDLSQRNLKSEDLARIRGALRLVRLLGALALSLELGIEYKFLTTGDSGNHFYFRKFLPSVRLTPNGGNFTPGDTIQFTVEADFAPPNAVYAWSLLSITAATLDDQHGHTGTSFETTEKQVLLKTTGGSLGNAVVQVEVFDGPGPDRQSIGSDQTTLTNDGAVNLFIQEYTVGSTIYINLQAVKPKPHTPEGGNHYVGGTLKADITYNDLVNPVVHNHMEFIVPPFTGLPGSAETPPQFTGTKINPSVGGGTSGMAGVDCYDLGDRLVLIKAKGIYFTSSTPEQIAATRHAIDLHLNATTLVVTFP